MSHYYTKNKDGGITLLKEVTTPSQARKHGSALVSVTTLLGYLPNDYINNIWKPKKYVELGREHPDLDASEITALMWGVRTCPETGEEISSSDFGTRAHARLEDHMNGIIQGEDILRNHPYDPIVAQTVRWLSDNGFTPVQAEKMVACEKRGTAGTIDLIALKEEKLCLLDYKFRDCPSGEGKFYDKDVAQLAVEANIVAEQYRLDYIPGCLSICIDTNTGVPHVKQWTRAAVNRGQQLFEAARLMYYNHPGLGFTANK